MDQKYLSGDEPAGSDPVFVCPQLKSPSSRPGNRLDGNKIDLMDRCQCPTSSIILINAVGQCFLRRLYVGKILDVAAL